MPVWTIRVCKYQSRTDRSHCFSSPLLSFLSRFFSTFCSSLHLCHFIVIHCCHVSRSTCPNSCFHFLSSLSSTAPSCCLPFICSALIQFLSFTFVLLISSQLIFVPPSPFSFIAILPFLPFLFLLRETRKPCPNEMLFRCVFTGLISQLPRVVTPHPVSISLFLCSSVCINLYLTGPG